MIFETKALTKSFSDREVLRGVDLRAQSGRALGFLGRNGAGKTTTLRIMMGVFTPDAGQVLLDGQRPDYRRLRIGYMPEERGLYPKHPVQDQLIYLAELKGVKRADARTHMMRLMEQLDVAEYATKRLDTLSKGNQQKIQLVATLVSDPEIVVLDEPFSGLDPVNAVLLKDVVRDLIGKGRVVLFSSHQMHYVEEFCDDIAILNEGRVVIGGDLAQIKRGYERNRLWVRSADAQRMRTYISGHLPSLVRDVQERDGALLLTLDRPEQKRETMLALLSQQEIDVDGVDIYEPSLSDIFVSYTEGGV